MPEPVSVVKAMDHGQPLILRLTSGPQVTLSDIARAAGCTPSFVSKCAHGTKKPTRRVRHAAERLLGRPADELFVIRGEEASA